MRDVCRDTQALTLGNKNINPSLKKCKGVLWLCLLGTYSASKAWVIEEGKAQVGNCWSHSLQERVERGGTDLVCTFEVNHTYS